MVVCSVTNDVSTSDQLARVVIEIKRVFQECDCEGVKFCLDNHRLQENGTRDKNQNTPGVQGAKLHDGVLQCTVFMLVLTVSTRVRTAVVVEVLTPCPIVVYRALARVGAVCVLTYP